MQIGYRLTDICLRRPALVTIGNFDGVHLGHQRLIRQVVSSARAGNYEAVLVTFWPLPWAVVQRREPAFLTLLPEKLRLLEWLGLDAVVVVPFDREMVQMRARRFIELLQQHLAMCALWEGPDFALGYQREGDGPFLTRLGGELGYHYHTCEPVWLEGQRVSSSRIRRQLEAGELFDVAACLGRPFRISGALEKERKGPALCNQAAITMVLPANQALPPNGEYFGRIWPSDQDDSVRASCLRTPLVVRRMGMGRLMVTGWDQDVIPQAACLELADAVPSERAMFPRAVAVLEGSTV